MSTGLGRTGLRQLLTVAALVALGGGFTPSAARADDRNWDHQDQRWRDDDRSTYYERERADHYHRWRHENRVYYGGAYYTNLPPAVIYAPPPQPYGLNLMFNLGR